MLLLVILWLMFHWPKLITCQARCQCRRGLHKDVERENMFMCASLGPLKYHSTTQLQGPVALSALLLFELSSTVSLDWTLIRITA